MPVERHRNYRREARAHPGTQGLLLTAGTMVLTLIALLLVFLVMFQFPVK